MGMSKSQLWNERYAAKELVWSAGPNRLLADEVRDLAAGRALDVACGEGRNAIWLAEQGWTVSAIDFSHVGIDKGRQIAERRGVEIDWTVGDVAADQLPVAEFDLVAVLYLHTSPEERSDWLPNVVASVASGGVFIYIGHDPRNITEGVGGPQKTELLPDADEINAALTDFRIADSRIIERAVDADPGHGADLQGVALDTYVRAIRL